MNPTYTDILKEIGNQLTLRKRYLFTRTLMIVWPFLLAGIALWFGNAYYGKELVEQTLTSFPYGIFVALYAFFAVIYSIVMSFTFDIEKRIWIDSFFDKRELGSAQSWGIAQALFWPAFWFRVKVFVRYYVLPIFVLFVFIISTLIFNIAYAGHVGDVNLLGFSVIFGILCLIVFGIYTYYLRIKLRFTWFLFLDAYKGKETNTTQIFADVEKLHKITKGENFVKAIVVTLGADSVQAVINMSVATLAVFSRLAGGSGQGFAVLSIFTKELSRQIASYAQIAGFYLLYMVARKEVFGEEQEVNEYVYGLGEGK